MKICHINTSAAQGGAAKASLRLHEEMLDSGIDSRYLSAIGNPNAIKSKVIQKWKARILSPLLHQLSRQSAASKAEFGLFSPGWASLNILKDRSLVESDVIILHWVCYLLSVQDIRALLDSGKQICWVMHDMWPFTGGCHHSFGCNNYRNSCGYCQSLVNAGPHDKSNAVIRKKADLWTELSRLTLISPSKWLAATAKSSSLFCNAKIVTVPNLLPEKIFTPIPQQVARDLLGLPNDKKIILFGADDGSRNPYKGYSYLLEALQSLSKADNSLFVAVFGGSRELDLSNVPFPTKNFGRLGDDYSLALLYNAADVFVLPSLADNFPTTVAESIACGTPVVGFDVGGVPDLICNSVVGYLAKYRDSDDLANGIKVVLAKDANQGEIRNVGISVFGKNTVLPLWNSILQ